MAEGQDLEILFTTDTKNKLMPKSGQLIVAASEDSWNDFTYRIRCSFKVCLLNDTETYEGSMFIGFLPYNDKDPVKQEQYKNINHSLYQSLHSLTSDGVVLADEMPPFFTMQINMQEYRSLIESLGKAGSETVLRCVNDLVYFKNEEPHWFTKAIESKVFQLGFMRNSEPFFAFHNAYSVLNGVQNENLSGISSELNLSFKLEGFTTQHALRLKFNSNS